jgi:MFS family permease
VAVAVEKPRVRGLRRIGDGPGDAVPRLAISRAVSFAGGGAAFWALSAVIYEMTHSATLVAVAALASFSVPALLSPIAGLLGDHHDRKRVMIASEIAGALCFLGLALASSPAALLGLRVLAAVVWAPMDPALKAALPSLVAPDKLDRANAAISKAGTAGVLIGPAVAGLMLASVGASFVFLLNALTFLVSAGLIISLKGDFRPKFSERGRLAAGYAFLKAHPVLRPVTVAYGVAFVGVGVSIPAEIVLATEFGVGTLGYAGLVCLWGVGSLLGAVVANRLQNHPRRVLVIGVSALAVAAGFFTVTAAPIFAVALLGMGIGGIGEGLWEVSQASLVQRVTPDGVRSRVFAGSDAVMQVGIAVGLLVSGLVTAKAGATGAFAVAGAASLVAALILLGRGASAESASRHRRLPTMSLGSPPFRPAGR